LSLSHTRSFQVRAPAVPHRKVNNSAIPKPNEQPIRGQLNPIDKLAFSIENVVHWPPIDILSGAHPKIPLSINAG